LVRLWPMAKISVVVPAHNEEATLSATLEALRRQDLKEFELIVVDSASTDATAEVAKAYDALVIRVDEPGSARARQAGFEAASGHIVASTEADSIPPPDWLGRLVGPFRNPQVVGTYGGLSLIGDGLAFKMAERFFIHWQRLNHALKRPIFCGANFAVRKRIFLEVGGFMWRNTLPHEGEDIRLAVKLLKMGKVVFMPDLLVATSTRSFAGPGRLRYLIRHARNYFQTYWLRYGNV